MLCTGKKCYDEGKTLWSPLLFIIAAVLPVRSLPGQDVNFQDFLTMRYASGFRFDRVKNWSCLPDHPQDDDRSLPLDTIKKFRFLVSPL